MGRKVKFMHPERSEDGHVKNIPAENLVFIDNPDDLAPGESN